MEKVQEKRSNPEEDTDEDDFLEECEVCKEKTVFVNGRCRTCMNCGYSGCSI